MGTECTLYIVEQTISLVIKLNNASTVFSISQQEI